MFLMRARSLARVLTLGLAFHVVSGRPQAAAAPQEVLSVGAGTGSSLAAASDPERGSWSRARSQAAAAATSPADPPGRADYSILATYEDDVRGLNGRLTLRWTNNSEVAADELWFHLYWNAYANNRSTHLEESGGRLRDKPVLADEWGWQRVTSAAVAGEDILPSLRFRQPDGGPADDRSVVSLTPPAPVQPGETITVDLSWVARFPRVRRRTGAKGDFLFAAHWFPKLGVFEGARGWNCHEFHANTEFYSNYGWYDVTLDLPERYAGKVFASGVQAEPATEEAGRVITRFLAPSKPDRESLDATGKRPLVHGFAWTADPRYVVKQGTFNFDRWRSRFDYEVAAVQEALGPDKSLRLRTVQVTVAIHPERLAQWERHYEATCAALFFYGLWYGEYPYEHITVVDPAWGARAAGGMEYPTLFTCGTRLFNRPEMHSPEGVTVHEAGHQFWYGLVGNNEFEAAWMDEGFNSFTDSEVMWRVYGAQQATTRYSGIPYAGVSPVPGPGGGTLASALSLRKITVPFTELSFEPLHPCGPLDLWRDQPQLTNVRRLTDPRKNDRARYLRDPDRDPIDTAGWMYVDRSSYSTNSYPRTAVALRTLKGLVGDEAFWRGMRAYSEAWRYRHPYPDDFFASFLDASGADVAWYFDEVFRGTGTVDWSVEVEQDRVPEPEGYFQAGPTDEFVKLEAQPPDAPEAPAQDDPPTDAEPESVEQPVASDGAADEQDEQPWHAEVTLLRRGELRLPVTLELTFEDGTSERRVWTRAEQGEKRWLRIVLEGGPKLVSAVLDPDGLYYLDADLSNDRWYDEVDRLAPVRWTERGFNRWLHLLHWQSGIGG